MNIEFDIMFNSLSKGLSSVIRKITTGTTLDKEAVQNIVQDIRKILVQSDVDTSLSNQICENIRTKTLKNDIPKGLTLRENVLKVIYDELVDLLGGTPANINKKKKIMLIGLFGSGKTTTSGKLAKYFIKQGLKPGLVALDYHRPGASEQLEQLGKQINVPVHYDKNKNVFDAAKNGMEKFSKLDVIIFDTSGRNALDGNLANELKKLNEIIKPDESILVLPADLGKIAKVQAEEFHKIVGITGVIITKMDGTAKAGGSIAATSVSGAKVKFIGVGEKLDDFELYNPTRFVSRLLGLGDLQTLLEKAKEIEINKDSVERVMEGKFTLKDFIDQIEAMEKMGPMSQIVNMIPGMGNKISEDKLNQQEGKLKKFKHIIQSMTKEERELPSIINLSRIIRISKGSGKNETDVRELLNQYNSMKKMMKQFGGGGMKRGPMKDIAKQFGISL